MALDQAALLEVLDALEVADVSDRVRVAAETVYQALIEAERTGLIGAAPHERSEAPASSCSSVKLLVCQAAAVWSFA